jgi:NADP-dependent 3-hydroxy acid dehydrogenase YdfG
MNDDVLSSFRLDGRVAVVTGASSGLGDRFAQMLHGAGASVLATARRSDRLDSLAASVGDAARLPTCRTTTTAIASSTPRWNASAGSTSS